jgi:hypothetical protein
MRRQASPTLIWGLVLLAASALMLLARWNALPTAELIWTALFGAAGLGFGYALLADRRRWWAAIPAGALLGLALVVAWNELVGGDDSVGGALFLGMVALGFWAAYARDRQQWWAVIPGGVVTTLAVVALLSPTATSPAAGAAVAAVFFVGLAATFVLVALLGGGRRPWAYVPAAVFAGIGLLSTVQALADLPVSDYLAPAVLAVTGVLVIWRTMPHRHGRS